MKKLIPAIVSDIDGVIVRGKLPIKGSPEVLRNILSRRFPFYLLTNGGGCTEQDKAASINEICRTNLKTENIILNYTPLRPILKLYSDKYVLVCGAGKLAEIAIDCGLRKYITIDELAVIRNSLDFKQFTNEMRDQHQNQLKQRGISGNLDVEAIFILYDPIRWEDSLTYITQIVKLQPKIPIYVVNNDITYADVFKLPRLAFGAFTNVLRKIINSELSIEPNIIYYGKPTFNTFDFVEKTVRSKYDNVGEIFMIGDNPASDIRGANAQGWVSILVKSGVFRGQSNDAIDPAQIVVEDMREAYDYILSRMN